jgi:DNA-binding NarL/FixJ family response regulator
METIRLLLADCHAHVRASLLTRLRHEADFEFVGEATTSAETIALAYERQPHVVLMDPIMDGESGLEAIRHIAEKLPQTAIIVLTAVADKPQRLAWRRAGASCILEKGIETSQLVDVLRAVGHVSETERKND